MEQAQACLATLPFRVVVEHQNMDDLSGFLERLERMRPDVVLLDITGWKDQLESLAASIRAATGEPMIVALNAVSDADAILASLRAGINEYLFPPLQDSLRKALEKRSTERSHRRDSGKQGAGKALGFFSAKGGCGATTLACHVAAELGHQNLKDSAGRSGPRFRHGPVHHQNQIGLFGAGRDQQYAPSGHSLLESARFQRHSGRGDCFLAGRAGFPPPAHGRSNPARAGFRPAELRLDAGGPGPQPEPHGHGRSRGDRRSLSGHHPGRARRCTSPNRSFRRSSTGDTARTASG